MAGARETDFLRATPVLKCGDYARSRDYYVGALGFRVLEEGGDPPRFGVLQRGASVIFLNAWHGPPAPSSGGWSAYLHVRGLDDLCAEFKTSGAEICRPIEATVYGMREFEVADPDGNIVCFGENLDPEIRPDPE